MPAKRLGGEMYKYICLYDTTRHQMNFFFVRRVKKELNLMYFNGVH